MLSQDTLIKLSNSYKKDRKLEKERGKKRFSGKGYVVSENEEETLIKEYGVYV